jgi:hypothetical protein
MNPLKLLIGLVPWVLFTLLVRLPGDNTAAYAALAAAALSLVLLLATLKGGVKVIEAGSVVTFGVLAAVAFLGGPAGNVWVTDYGRATAAFVLAAVMLGSTLLVPFTEQYARESVPPQYWGSPTFRAVNRKISGLWGLILLGMGVVHVLAAIIDPASTSGGFRSGVGGGGLMLNWLIPIGLVFVGITQTKKIAGSAAEPRTRQVAR